jgi:hypothetical protein
MAPSCQELEPPGTPGRFTAYFRAQTMKQSRPPQQPYRSHDLLLRVTHKTVTGVWQRFRLGQVIHPNVLTRFRPLAHNPTKSIQAAAKPNTRIP